MSQHLHQAFGRELVAQRQAAYESAARHSALVRTAKLARREHALAARAEIPASPPTSSVSAAKVARACCAADLG
jgi:hypothetical protein